jgi:hypothetical protein
MYCFAMGPKATGTTSHKLKSLKPRAKINLSSSQLSVVIIGRYHMAPTRHLGVETTDKFRVLVPLWLVPTGLGKREEEECCREKWAFLVLAPEKGHLSAPDICMSPTLYRCSIFWTPSVNSHKEQKFQDHGLLAALPQWPGPQPTLF